MRAAVYPRNGDADVIEIRDVPAPRVGSDDVLVDVAYAGLNRADLLERAGRYGPPIPDGRFTIPGLEYAGTVGAVGDNVSKARIGERVFGIATGGAHAQRIAVHAGTACAIPAGLSLEAAGAAPEAFMTAWDALVGIARFRLGQVAVVHAIGSAVGLAALALAKHAGGRVLGTSRSADKLRRAEALGLDAGVLLDDDWPRRAHELSGGRGADVALDFVGTPIFQRNVDALAVGGTIVQIGTLGGARGEISFRSFMAKRLSLVGTVLRSRPIDQKIALARGFQASIVPLFGSGVLRPVVDRVFPLAQIREAHRYMEADRNFGKIVIAIRQPDN